MATITEDQYLKLKAQTLVDMARIRNGNAMFNPDTIELTCDSCPFRFSCEYAADAYNTDGDCLAEK